MNLKIVVPSMGRHEDVITKNVVNDIIIVCPEKQLELYKEFNPEVEVISHPKSVKGITATRQFIIDTFDDVFMFDDDVLFMRKMFTEEGEPYKVTEPKMVRAILEQNAYISQQIGAKFFGFNNRNRPTHYRSAKPFKLSGYINGSYCGFLKGHGLKYDLRISDADDYYISGLNAYKHRYAFIDCRYAILTKDNFTKGGGCASYRTPVTMKEDTLLLRETFGEAITLKTATNAKMNIYEGERSLSIKFG